MGASRSKVADTAGVEVRCHEVDAAAVRAVLAGAVTEEVVPPAEG